MNKQHQYELEVKWTGNTGSGTSGYRNFERSHTIITKGKTDITASSDPAFRGDASKHNPEELLLASVSGCHMLWYLHLCAEAGVVVTAYTDHATGIMEETANGSGRFVLVTLHPEVVVTEQQMVDKANALHERANEMCFIANSLNFKVHHEPACRVLHS